MTELCLHRKSRNLFRAVSAVALTVVTWNICVSNLDGVDAFVLPPAVSSSRISGWIPPHRRVFLRRMDTGVKSSAASDDGDEALLMQVTKSQLVELCKQYQIDTAGTKGILLTRLRDYANQQAELERQRRRERIARVEAVEQDSKERHVIVSDYPEDDEDEGFFYIHAPDTASLNETTSDAPAKPPKPSYVTNSVVTAPPPPSTEPNENGERVVTVYSTSDQNDLTGVASAQPGQTFSDNGLMSGEASALNGEAAPWDMTASKQKSEATSKELEEATEIVSELVHVLLTMTGAPAFREEFSEGLMPLDGEQVLTSQSSPEGFVGFDPSKVPAEMLTQSSQALRANRGQVLQEVLRDYELRAIGHDGMAGDNAEKGGGHYREVSKVRAFLEGYRRAEMRRIARETITMLLDKLVTEGVEGLDFTMASMTRSSDDTNEAGELNDALLDYLNDAIRKQEKKVEQTVGVDMTTELAVGGVNGKGVEEEDNTAQFWNVSNEEGQRIETIDPNDPEVKNALEDEVSKSKETYMVNFGKPTPNTAAEQLLLLLCLLRDRIKAEASFGNDEKGRHLRILAYCLHAKTDADRDHIMMKEMGGSLDRLESFSELVASSIDYAESTSQQLQPSKTSLLNVNLLKGIHNLAEEIKDRQAWKASGAVRTQSKSAEQAEGV